MVRIQLLLTDRRHVPPTGFGEEKQKCDFDCVKFDILHVCIFYLSFLSAYLPEVQNKGFYLEKKKSQRMGPWDLSSRADCEAGECSFWGAK